MKTIIGEVKLIEDLFERFEVEKEETISTPFRHSFWGDICYREEIIKNKETNYKCKLCGDIIGPYYFSPYSLKDNLTGHIDFSHKENPIEGFTRIKENNKYSKDYVCQICGDKMPIWSTKNHLELHKILNELNLISTK